MPPKSQTSYHQSLDNCLYIPGVGHFVHDTYLGYGSLLDSDVDDTEVTSPIYFDGNTLVPDSLNEEILDCDEKLGRFVNDVDAFVDVKGIFLQSGRSGDFSPSTKKFNKFCDNFFEKRRKKGEQRGKAYIKGHDVVEEKGITGESSRSVDLSPKSNKFKRFCDKYLHI